MAPPPHQPSRPLSRRVRDWLAPSWREALVGAVLALVVCSVGIRSVPLLGRDEGRFAQSAREMLAAGELVVPSFGGEPRYHKPVLHAWCAMASFAAIGVSAWTARLPSVLAATALVGLLAWWARRRLPPGSGLLTALLLLAAPVVFVQARAATADMVTLLPTVVAMLALERICCRDERARWPVLFWIGMGVGVLAKGPLAPAVAVSTGLARWAMGRCWRPWQVAALLALTVVGWWWAGAAVLAVPLVVGVAVALGTGRGRSAVARLRPQWGVPLALLVVGPWAVAAWLATDGEYLRVAVGHHVLARSLQIFEGHGGFPGFYLATGVVAAFPWFAVLAGALGALRRRWREDPVLRFRVAWIVGSLVMLEMVRTKLVHYWLPAYPAGVLLVVGLACSPKDAGGRLGGVTRALLGVGASLLAAVPAAAVLLFGLEGMAEEAAVTGLPLLAVAAATLCGRPRGLRPALVAAATGALLTLLLLAGHFLPALAPRLVVPRAVDAVARAAGPSPGVVVYRLRDDELLFQLPLDTAVCRDEECLAGRLVEGPVVAVARQPDLEAFRASPAAVSVRVLERVRGLDLGRGRWVELVLFAPAGRGASGSAVP